MTSALYFAFALPALLLASLPSPCSGIPLGFLLPHFGRIVSNVTLKPVPHDPLAGFTVQGPPLNSLDNIEIVRPAPRPVQRRSANRVGEHTLTWKPRWSADIEASLAAEDNVRVSSRTIVKRHSKEGEEQDDDAGKDEKDAQIKAGEERQAQHEREKLDDASANTTDTRHASDTRDDGEDNERKDKELAKEEADSKNGNDQKTEQARDEAKEQTLPDAKKDEPAHMVIPSVDPKMIRDPLLRNVTLTYKHLRNHRPPPRLRSMEASASSTFLSSSTRMDNETTQNSTHSSPRSKTHMIIDLVPDEAADDVEAFIGALRDYLASLDGEKRNIFEKAYLAHADDDDKYALARALNIDVVRHVYTGVGTDQQPSKDLLADTDLGKLQGLLIPSGLAAVLRAMGVAQFQHGQTPIDDKQDVIFKD